MKWTHILLHHTAGPKGQTVDQIREEHQARGWKDIGYHYVIARSAQDNYARGYLQHGRPDTEAGAHAGVNKWNKCAIGVVTVGYFHPGSMLSEHMPDTLREDIICALCHLCRKYRIPAANILRHRDVRKTACPGDWYPFEEIKAEVTRRLNGTRQQKTATTDA